MNLFPLIPLSIAVLFAFKLTLIYVLAVIYGHVKPVFPYISDAGATHPEAAFFSILLFLEGILIAIMGWIRYKQIRYIVHNMPKPNENNNSLTIDENKLTKITKYNKQGLYLQIAVMLSVAMVAAFRSTEHLEIHLIFGAFPAFIASIWYFYIQTWTSYQFIPTVNSIFVARFRLFCSVLAIIFGTIMILSISITWFDVTLPYSEIRGPPRLWWDEKTGGYIGHVVSAVNENLMIFMMSPFYASFVCEFRRIHSHNGRLKFTFNDNVQSV